VHLGVAAFQMEKRGIHTERGNMNRAIEITNKQISQLRARIKKCKGWLYAQPILDAPTTITMMNNIANAKNLQTQSQRIRNLKTKAHVFMFLQQNNIYDMEQLVNKIEQIHRQFYDVSDKIKKVERRLDTLTEHLAQTENHKQYKPIYDKYKKLDPMKRDAFYDKHSDEIQLYENAKSYLDKIMNGKKDIPVKAWKKELADKAADKYDLMEKYYQLKDETHSVELLRRGAENLMLEDGRQTAPARRHGLEI
jgi:tetratricopeptide (TPR) repeat protein